MKKILFFVLFVTACVPSFANASEDWPLSILTTEEREVRLDLFIKLKELKYYSYKSTEDEGICKSILSKTKAGQYLILSPKLVLKDKKVNEAHPFTKCNNIHTMYIPIDSHENYDYKSTPMYNREYYDFSRYTKSNIWGIFAEGGILECGIKTLENCKKFASNNNGGYKIGTVFDADTCEIILAPNFIADTRLSWNDNSNGLYSENPSFFAFVLIKKHIYRVAFNINAKLNNFKHMFMPNGASLLFTNINNKKVCSFFTDDLRK